MAIVTNKSRFTLGFETETFRSGDTLIAAVSVTIATGASAGDSDGITDVVAHRWAEKPASKTLMENGVSIRFTGDKTGTETETASKTGTAGLDVEGFEKLHWKTQVKHAGEIKDLDLIERLLASEGLSEKVRDALETQVGKI